MIVDLEHCVGRVRAKWDAFEKAMSEHSSHQWAQQNGSIVLVLRYCEQNVLPPS